MGEQKKNVYGKKAPSVLLVDDIPLALLAQSHLLAQFGFYVVTASSPLMALEILKDAMVDFVMMDVDMLAMYGDRLAQVIHEEFPELPIIGITMKDSIELGSVDSKHFYRILTKPLTQEKIKFLYTANMTYVRGDVMAIDCMV